MVLVYQFVYLRVKILSSSPFSPQNLVKKAVSECLVGLSCSSHVMEAELSVPYNAGFFVCWCSYRLAYQYASFVQTLYSHLSFEVFC